MVGVATADTFGAAFLALRARAAITVAAFAARTTVTVAAAFPARAAITVSAGTTVTTIAAITAGPVAARLARFTRRTGVFERRASLLIDHPH